MAHIQKIYIMTLQRAKRLPYCLGALGANEAPMEDVVPVFGKDDLDYKTTRELCEDAVKDGFEAFQKILDGYFHNCQPIAYLAQRWNYLRLFRSIVEDGRHALILQDDYTIHGSARNNRNINFWHIDDLLGYLISLGDFKNTIFGIQPDDIPKVESIRETHEITNYSKLTEYTDYFSELVPCLVGQHDVAILMSPSGAQWMIDTITELPEQINVQVCLSHIWNSGMEQPKGNWTAINEAVCPIFGDEIAEKYLPSVVHTDVFNWQVQRRVADTCDNADGTWPTENEPGRPPTKNRG